MNDFGDSRESISEYIELWERFDVVEVPRPKCTESLLPPPPLPKDSFYVPSASRSLNLDRGNESENEPGKDTAPPVLFQLQTAFRRDPGAGLDTPTSIYSDYTPQSASPYTSIANSNPFRLSPQELIDSPFSSYASTSPLQGLHPAPPPPRPRSRARSTSASRRYTLSAHPPPTSALPPVPGLPAHPAVSVVKPPGQTLRGPPTPPPQFSDFKFEQPRSRPVTPQPPRGQQQNDISFKGYQIPRSKTPGPSGSTLRSGTPNSLASRISPDGPVINSKAAKMLGIDLQTPMVPQTRAPTPNRPFLMAPEANSRSPSPSFPTQLRSRAGSAQGWSSSPSSSARSSNSSGFSAASYDPTLDATSIWAALKRSKKPDTDLLTTTIVTVSHTPSKLPILRQKYKELYREDIKTTLKAETSGPYRIALLRLIVGPYESEADWLNSYGKRDSKSDVSSLPMDDKMVAEAIFGKQPDEIEQIKTAFAISNPGMSLENVVEDIYLGSAQHSITPSYGAIMDATSSPNLAFGRAVLRILRADREYETAKTVSLLNGDQLLTREAKLMGDVEDLYRAEKRPGGPGSVNKYLDQKLLLELIFKRSDIYLRDLCTRFRERHVRELVDVITSRDKVLAGSTGILPNNLVIYSFSPQ